MFGDENIDELVLVLEVELDRVLDLHAPSRTKYIMLRQSRPWFTEEIRTQKKTVRRREKIWRKYREDHQFVALKVECNKYRKMLNQSKCNITSVKVAECKGDSKLLYRLVNNLTGSKDENPMPEHSNSETLAENFADFFLEKL